MLTDQNCNVAWRDLRGASRKKPPWSTFGLPWKTMLVKNRWEKPMMTPVFAFCLILQWIWGGHLARSEPSHSGILNDQDIQRHDSACTGDLGFQSLKLRSIQTIEKKEYFSEFAWKQGSHWKKKQDKMREVRNNFRVVEFHFSLTT